MNIEQEERMKLDQNPKIGWLICLYTYSTPRAMSFRRLALCASAFVSRIFAVRKPALTAFGSAVSQIKKQFTLMLVLYVSLKHKSRLRSRTNTVLAEVTRAAFQRGLIWSNKKGGYFLFSLAFWPWYSINLKYY